MNVELIKDNDGKEIVNITLTEAEQADLFHPVPDEFVKGGKYSWKLFKKRIKEFPFIKKQPRFKKYFYTQKRITLDGK
ncbi:MAG: hypothetical protein LBC44_01145, partial [Mycoplasmataceae bacterium]|nr:hypothetical protein [Mycoplasmataceae bacterium]